MDGLSSFHNKVDNLASNELVWSDEPDYSFWNFENLEEYSPALLSDDYAQSLNEREESQSSDSISQGQVNETIQEIPPPLRERKGVFYLKRQVGFARVKMQQADLSIEDWLQLLEMKDSKATKIKKQFDEKYNRDSKYAQLVRKLKRFPKDLNLLCQLQEFNKTQEQFNRQREIIDTKPPMSKARRDKLALLIKKLRRDVEGYDSTRKFRLLRSTISEQQKEQMLIKEGKKVLGAKYAVGDAIADELIDKLEQLRIMLRKDPRDESLWGELWQEVDDWMQKNQLEYTPLVKPCVFDR